MANQILNDLKTHLISGAENTFHICFSDEKITSASLKKIAQQVCSMKEADGMIFLRWENKEQDQLVWDFFNNDGSEAEMCGNATRCVGYYVKNILKSSSPKWYLKTTAGIIQIEGLSEDKFKIVMTPIVENKSSFGFYCDTGVPHLVLSINDFGNYTQYKAKARQLRFDQEFAPQGTNVTYVELLAEKNKIKAVSYERGVEDFTQACGTGAAAAAFYNLKTRNAVLTEVSMPGGVLTFNLTNLQKPIMIGPAKLKGEFKFNI